MKRNFFSQKQFEHEKESLEKFFHYNCMKSMESPIMQAADEKRSSTMHVRSKLKCCLRCVTAFCSFEEDLDMQRAEDPEHSLVCNVQ
jgi:hypothetical protein